MRKKPCLRPRLWTLTVAAIDQGIIWGLSRAYKYMDTPSRKVLHEHLARELANAFDEHFRFDDEEGQ